MTDYDYNRPYIEETSLALYTARNRIAARYGKEVKATLLSNVEYRLRFARLKKKQRMRPPPSAGRIFLGYLVIRNLGTPDQYETWMPDHVFEELYRVSSPAAP